MFHVFGRGKGKETRPRNWGHFTKARKVNVKKYFVMKKTGYVVEPSVFVSEILPRRTLIDVDRS